MIIDTIRFVRTCKYSKHRIPIREFRNMEILKITEYTERNKKFWGFSGQQLSLDNDRSLKTARFFNFETALKSF